MFLRGGRPRPLSILHIIPRSTTTWPTFLKCPWEVAGRDLWPSWAQTPGQNSSCISLRAVAGPAISSLHSYWLHCTVPVIPSSICNRNRTKDPWAYRLYYIYLTYFDSFESCSSFKSGCWSEASLCWYDSGIKLVFFFRVGTFVWDMDTY